MSAQAGPVNTVDWDSRFDTGDYVFGTEPSVFLTSNQGLVPRGARALCVADGEGRNGTWLAAARGCEVTAFDLSPNALSKAHALADKAGVTLDLQVSTIKDWDWSRTYDLVVAVFIQFANPTSRATLFENLKRAVAPGGRLMLHGYTPEQVALGTGGPRDPDHMYTEALLHESFGDMEILRLGSYEKELSEGAGHSGRSALIDLIADKPA